MRRFESKFPSDLFRELWVAAVALLTILLVSSAGFHVIEDWAWFDALYMVIITLSTVGYGEVHDLTPAGRAWAIGTIFAGVGVMSFTFLTIGRLAMMGLAEGELRRGLARRRMKQVLQEISGHHVICGYGRIGRTIAQCLQADGLRCVVIENDEQARVDIEEDGFPYVIGDATRDSVLQRAGIERAQAMAVVTPSVPDNVFIALTARALSPDIYIMARSTDPSSERRLIRAGADKALSPHEIGGRQMASSLVRPTVVELLDLAASGDTSTFAMEEMQIHHDSEMAGVQLMDSGLRQRFGVIAVAIKRDDEMMFNPTPDVVLESGDTLITIGHREDLETLLNVLQPQD